MAYQAKRQKRFREEFELVDESGDVKHTLYVDLDTDDIIPKINRKYTDLTRMLAEINETKRKEITSTEEADQKYELLGNAVVNMLEAVFGKENTEVILEFYENRYIELVKEVLPFITKCVIPRCMEIRKENQNRILESYNRKQRRILFQRKRK